jgi:hypothetical protein
MLKYLPNLKKLSNSSINPINKKISLNFSAVSKFSLIRINKFYFSQFNKDGKTQKKELSFFERLKEKFTFKEEEKIDHSKLQRRDEEEDSQILSTKVDSELTFTEEERQSLQKLMEQQSEEKEITERERINIDIEIPLSEMKGIQDKSETFEILISKFNLRVYEPNQTIRRQFNNLNYEEVIQPRIEELLKIGFNKTQIKVILQK